MSKLYVGNLSYNTTNHSLGKFFETVGEIINAHVVSFTNRSNGFGFVEMKDAKTAKEAQSKLNCQELDGRKIYVEIAKENGGCCNAQRSRISKFHCRVSIDIYNGHKHRPHRCLRTIFNNNGRDIGDVMFGYDGAVGIRKNNRNRNNTNGPQSLTRVYVSNLPYSLTEKDLAKQFENYEIKEITIIRDRFNERSYGFGFVEFYSHEDQRKALEEKSENFEIRGRSIKVRPALCKDMSVVKKKKKEGEEGDGEEEMMEEEGEEEERWGRGGRMEEEEGGEERMEGGDEGMERDGEEERDGKDE